MTRRVLPSQKLPELTCEDSAVQRFVNQELRKHVAEVYQQFLRSSAWEIQSIGGEWQIVPSQEVDAIGLIANSTRAYTTTDLDFSLLDEDPNLIVERSIKVARTSGANIGGAAFGSAGTLAAPEYPTNGDVFLEVRGYGWDDNGAAFTQQARIYFDATQTWNSTSRGSRVVIQGTPNGSTTLTTVATFQPSGVAIDARVLNTAGGFQTTASASDTGANAVHAIVDNNGGTARFIGYNWGTSTIQPVSIVGSTITLTASTTYTVDGNSVALNAPTTLGTSGATPTHRLNTNTATTVGAAGGASALPATPTGYVIININGTDRKIPYYAT